MPSPDAALTRHDSRSRYYYRRQLGMRDLLPAIGIAIGAGFFAFYVTRLLLQRTPLDVPRAPRPGGGRAPLRQPREHPAPERSRR